MNSSIVEELDDIIVDVPLLGLFNPILIVQSPRTWMWNQLAVDSVGNQIFPFEILDTIVGVASDADDDFWVENFDDLCEVVQADFR